MKVSYKFFITSEGCMGHIGNNKYRLFAVESEYREWYKENEED